MFAFEADQSKVFYDQGLQFKAANQLEQAEESFKKAIDLKPNVSEYHFELSNLYALRHDWLKQPLAKGSGKDSIADGLLDSCQRELEDTLRLNPQYLPAIYNLGVVLKNKGQYERAREQFRKVLEQDPHQVNAYLQIAGTYEAQGFYDEARDIYKQAKEMDYGNTGIDAALQELDKMEKEEQLEQKRNFQMPSQLLNGRYQSPYMVQDYLHQNQQQGQGSLAAAGMMLAQQFIQSMGKKEN